MLVTAAGHGMLVAGSATTSVVSTLYAPGMMTGVADAAELRWREHRRREQSEATRTRFERKVAVAHRQAGEPARAMDQLELTSKLMSTGVLGTLEAMLLPK